MRTVLTALLVCAVSVRSQSGTAPSLAEAAATDKPFQDAGGFGADVTRLLTALLDGQVETRKALLEAISEISDTTKEALSTLQEAQRTQVLGQPCRSDSDCSSLRADTACNSKGRCACGEGLQEAAGGTCRPFPRLSEPCRHHTDCQGATQHSLCSDHVCVCADGYVSDNSTGCRHPRLSEACTHYSHCQRRTEHSACKDNRCVCETYYWNDQDAVCRPYPRLLEACNTTSECLARSENSVCREGVCACESGYLPRWYGDPENQSYDGCVKTVSFGEPCSLEAQCGIMIVDMLLSNKFKMTCTSGLCKCPYKTISPATARRLKVRLHGESDCDGGYLAYYGKSITDKIFCDADWTTADADVLCRTLGFSGSSPQLPEEAPPLDRYQCAQYKVVCSGTEERFDDCQWKVADGNDSSTPVYVKCHEQE